MSNRYYTEFSDRNVCCRAKPPPNGQRRPNANLPNESTARWAGMTKEPRSNRSLGMTPIKTFVAGGYMSKGMSRVGPMPPKGALNTAMREVFTNEPSTVTRANVSGLRKRKMLQAIAFSKARKASR